MREILFLFLFLFLLRSITCHWELCSNHALQDRSCSNQILDDNGENDQSCRVLYFPNNSSQCKEMEFGPITEDINIGDLKLEPYIWNFKRMHFSTNYTVLNITFSKIKWKTMKFRFERYGTKNTLKNHCRSIVISSNVSVKDQSVLYYDCWWSEQDSTYVGQNYILDFEAEGDMGVKRGQYYFTVPSSNMLSPTVQLHEWKPFIYIEISTTALKLHILPAPPSIGIKRYQIEVVNVCKRCEEGEDIVVQKTVFDISGEVTYEYSLFHKYGSYYFLVTPLHDECLSTPNKVCHSVRSPTILITNDSPVTVICIASVTSLVVGILFAYYILLRMIRKVWCKDYTMATDNESVLPPKILVIYSPANKLHTECVTSFVNYLRYECGLEVMYDCDISNTSHGDPYIWCEEAFKLANYIVYIVGPTEELQMHNNITEQIALTAHRNVDTLQLNLLKASRATKNNKQVLNIVFEHARKCAIPVETQNDTVFYLLKDWPKLISVLSKNILAKQQLMRTEKGRCLLEDLKRAKKYMNQKCTFDDVVIKCENIELGGVDKKVLL